MSESIHGLPSVDGHYLSAVLQWAMKACPRPTEDDDSLSHFLVTTDLQILCCDGDRFHCAHLPRVPGLRVPASFALRRDTVESFLHMLKAACRIVGKQNPLHVYLDTVLDGEPGLRAVVEVGGELWPWSFQRCQLLGRIPPRWVSPVSEDAQPIAAPPAQLRGTHLSDATAIEETVATTRQAREGGPVRIDMTALVKSVEEKMVVATAVLLPVGTRARFMSQDQAELFTREKPGVDPGRSIASLVLDSPDGVTRPGAEGAGEVIFDATAPRRPQSVDDALEGLRRAVDEVGGTATIATGRGKSVTIKPRQPTAGGRELRQQLGTPTRKRAPAAAPAGKTVKRGAAKGTGKGSGRGRRS